VCLHVSGLHSSGGVPQLGGVSEGDGRPEPPVRPGGETPTGGGLQVVMTT